MKNMHYGDFLKANRNALSLNYRRMGLLPLRYLKYVPLRYKTMRPHFLFTSIPKSFIYQAPQRR